MLCGLFGVTRQSHYKAIRRVKTISFEHHLIIQRVDEIRKDLPRVGGKKLHYMLQDEFKLQGIKIGRDQFFNLLRDNNRLIKRKRSGIRTTYSYRWFNRFDNLLKNFSPDAPNQVWVSDITYVRTIKGFAYLSLITDSYSRRIMGYHLSKDLSTNGCVKALKMAINSCTNTDGIIHHSDRGVQYCSTQYTKILEEGNIRSSMTQPASPLDNAIAERINGIIKQEFLDTYYLSGVRDTRQILKKVVQSYNSKRPHSSLAYKTPNQCHYEEHV